MTDSSSSSSSLRRSSGEDERPRLLVSPAPSGAEELILQEQDMKRGGRGLFQSTDTNIQLPQMCDRLSKPVLIWYFRARAPTGATDSELV